MSAGIGAFNATTGVFKLEEDWRALVVRLAPLADWLLCCCRMYSEYGVFSLKVMSSGAFKWFGPSGEGMTTRKLEPDLC